MKHLLDNRIAWLDTQRRLAFLMGQPAYVHAAICAASRRAISARIALGIREGATA